MKPRHFDFGKNWIAFSQRSVTPERYAAARNDLRSLLGTITLQGASFLDIGFGQGLSILAAADAGASVTGCDINRGCIEALSHTANALQKVVPERIIAGSILEENTVAQLRTISPEGFDIVHSWGVLHHTGNMKKAISTTCTLVAPEGHLVLAIYNRHWSSPLWHIIKKHYNYSPAFCKQALITMLLPVITVAKLIVTRKKPFRQERGMDFRFDVIDWIGGYPYEYASTQDIISSVSRQGFECLRVIAAHVPTGCNQFIFRKT